MTLTPGCTEKLARYALAAGPEYVSPYVVQRTGSRIELRGYSEEDVRAIQRGCNIIDDTQGALARDPQRERWSATRYIRGRHLNCDHCHQSLGDKQDAAGRRLKGLLGLGASWVMADMYDRFTGLLLPFELRQMQCYIHSSNGYKPNIADDVIRDVTAYSRFLSAALGLRIGNHYDEQGIDEIAASDTGAPIVKLCDRLDNLRFLAHSPKAEKKRRYIRTTTDYYLPMAARTNKYLYDEISRWLEEARSHVRDERQEET